jgi:hypothetical protein
MHHLLKVAMLCCLIMGAGASQATAATQIATAGATQITTVGPGAGAPSEACSAAEAYRAKVCDTAFATPSCLTALKRQKVACGYD